MKGPHPSDLDLEPLVDLGQLKAARSHVRHELHFTPLVSATLLGREAGVELWLKCENLQKTGSFKVRGVLNKLKGLDSEARARGVVTVSAGNHAQALAWGARAAGIPCKVVMPERASRTKAAASRGYGAEVILRGDVFEAFDHALTLAEAEKLTFIHPFDDPEIILGQGTVGLEILEQMPEPPDVVVVPVGGGGLISGVAAAVKLSVPEVRVYGVEPTGAAAMRRSLDEGGAVHLDVVDTIADGLAPPMAGELTFRHVRRYVDDVVLVTDQEIAGAVGKLLSRTKLLAEPAGAAGVAALLANRLPVRRGEQVVCVLSGGNIDMSELVDLP